MTETKVCRGCFTEWEEGNTACSCCGWEPGKNYDSIFGWTTGEIFDKRYMLGMPYCRTENL